MLYTIGYSSFYEEEKLIETIKKLGIKSIYDVRTFPYSNAFPQYNQPTFSKKLKDHKIDYQFLGENLGGLIVKREVRKGIKTLKDLTRNPLIKQGLNFLYKKAKNENIAIMCAEKSPFDCHRFLAIGATLYFYADTPVLNIVENKVFSVEESINNWKTENNLLNLSLEPEKLVLERLVHLYKNLNKREEKFPEKSKVKNLSLF